MKIIRPITLQDANLVSSTVLENEYPTYNLFETYNISARVLNLGVNIHDVYESVWVNTDTDKNVNRALTDTKYWIKVGADNRWRMFDTSVSSITTASNEIKVVLQGLGPLSDIFADNVSAQFITVKITDVYAGVVFDETQPLLSDRGVDNWYDFFYTSYQARKTVLVEDLPKYIDTTVEITLTSEGGNVSIGALTVGYARIIGETKPGVKLGISDFSTKSRDDFGNFTILERAYSKYMNLEIWVKSSEADSIYDELAELRATACVYVGNNEDGDRQAANILGFYSDFYEAINYNEYSEYTLEIEGLT